MAFPQTYCTGPCFIFVGRIQPPPPDLSGGYTRGPAPGDEMGGYVRGPVPALDRVTAPLGAGTGASGFAPTLLGTCEVGPRIVLKPLHRPLRTSESGDAADDLMFMGEEAMAFATLNWYREGVYQAIASRPFIRDGFRGTTYNQSVGTLMKRERQTFRLYFAFPYVGKATAAMVRGNIAVGAGGFSIGVPVMVGNPAMKDMPPGYRFLAAYLAGPDELDPLGTKARKVGLAFHCIKERAAVAGNYGAGRVYDHDLRDLAGATYA